MSNIHERLEYLRGELRAECISYGELVELQGLADHIEPGDTELLEAAGVPEFREDFKMTVEELMAALHKLPQEVMDKPVAFLDSDDGVVFIGSVVNGVEDSGMVFLKEIDG